MTKPVPSVVFRHQGIVQVSLLELEQAPVNLERPCIPFFRVIVAILAQLGVDGRDLDWGAS